jgi:hypothetical protein
MRKALLQARRIIRADGAEHNLPAIEQPDGLSHGGRIVSLVHG